MEISCSKYSGSGYLSVSSAGKVKIAKGTKAGTYTIKVKINAASTANYKSASAIKTITVKISNSTTTTTSTPTSSSYVLNTSSKAFHYSSCASVARMSDANRAVYNGSRNDLISKGYHPCGNCHP